MPVVTWQRGEVVGVSSDASRWLAQVMVVMRQDGGVGGVKHTCSLYNVSTV